MSKYSYEFKKKVVTAYLNGEGGTEKLAKRFGIASSTGIKEKLGWMSPVQYRLQLSAV